MTQRGGDRDDGRPGHAGRMRVVRAAGVGDIPEGGAKVFAEGRFRVAIFRVNGAYHALDDHCPHEGWSLAGGILDRGIVTCAGHEWQFDVRTGACLTLGRYTVRRFEVWVEGEDILIGLPEGVDRGPGREAAA
jgi:nitrite reductase/ring-hydroxylating ferredoxin subunit